MAWMLLIMMEWPLIDVLRVVRTPVVRYLSSIKLRVMSLSKDKSTEWQSSRGAVLERENNEFQS